MRRDTAHRTLKPKPIRAREQVEPENEIYLQSPYNHFSAIWLEALALNDYVVPFINTNIV